MLSIGIVTILSRLHITAASVVTWCRKEAMPVHISLMVDPTKSMYKAKTMRTAMFSNFVPINVLHKFNENKDITDFVVIENVRLSSHMSKISPVEPEICRKGGLEMPFLSFFSNNSKYGNYVKNCDELLDGVLEYQQYCRTSQKCRS